MNRFYILIAALLYHSIQSLIAAPSSSVQAHESMSAIPPDIAGRELVTLRGKDLPEFKQSPVATIRVFSYDGEFRPVAFQIDSVDPLGRYLLPDGPGAQQLHRFLEANDELVFYARDLGAKAPATQAPPCGSGVLVSLPIGRTGSSSILGWIYVSVCTEDTPYYTGDLARYVPGADAISTSDYILGFDSAAPALPSRLHYLREVGGSGQEMLSGIHVSGEAMLLGGLIHLTRTTRDFKSERIAWKDGPVRVVRRSALQIRTIGSYYTNPGTFTVESMHAAGLVAFSVTMDTNTDLDNYLSDLLMSVAWDFVNFGGMHVRFPGVSTPVVVDGVATRDEQAATSSDASWIYAEGRHGSFVGRLAYNARSQLGKRLFLREGKGGELKLGYRLSNLQRVTRGRSEYRAEIVNLPGGSYDIAVRLISERSKPLIRLSRP